MLHQSLLVRPHSHTNQGLLLRYQPYLRISCCISCTQLSDQEKRSRSKERSCTGSIRVYEQYAGHFTWVSSYLEVCITFRPSRSILFQLLSNGCTSWLVSVETELSTLSLPISVFVYTSPVPLAPLRPKARSAFVGGCKSLGMIYGPTRTTACSFQGFRHLWEFWITPS